jgi:hypothetical protein
MGLVELTVEHSNWHAYASGLAEHEWGLRSLAMRVSDFYRGASMSRTFIVMPDDSAKTVLDAIRGVRESQG